MIHLSNRAIQETRVDVRMRAVSVSGVSVRAVTSLIVIKDRIGISLDE